MFPWEDKVSSIKVRGKIREYYMDSYTTVLLLSRDGPVIEEVTIQ